MAAVRVRLSLVGPRGASMASEGRRSVLGGVARRRGLISLPSLTWDWPLADSSTYPKRTKLPFSLSSSTTIDRPMKLPLRCLCEVHLLALTWSRLATLSARNAPLPSFIASVFLAENGNQFIVLSSDARAICTQHRTAKATFLCIDFVLPSSMWRSRFVARFPSLFLFRES